MDTTDCKLYLDSLTYSKVEQSYPNTSGKQHGEICGVVEFWFFIWCTKLHLGILG